MVDISPLFEVFTWIIALWLPGMVVLMIVLRVFDSFFGGILQWFAKQIAIGWREGLREAEREEKLEK